MAAPHVVVPQSFRPGQLISNKFLRISKREAKSLARDGFIESVDVAKRLWRWNMAVVADSKLVTGGRISLAIERKILELMAEEMRRFGACGN